MRTTREPLGRGLRSHYGSWLFSGRPVLLRRGRDFRGSVSSVRDNLYRIASRHNLIIRTHVVDDSSIVVIPNAEARHVFDLFHPPVHASSQRDGYGPRRR